MGLVEYVVQCPSCGRDVESVDEDDMIYIDIICDNCGYDGNALVKYEK